MKSPDTILRIFKKYAVCIILVLIILLASYLRLHNLTLATPALSQDEVVNGYDAYSIGHTLRDHHGTFLPRILGSFGDSASVALTYLTIPFVVIGGLTNESVRLPIALSGVISVLLIYLLTLEVSKNKRLALLAAFILAVSPWNITLTRWAIPPTIVPFFLLLFLWLFARAVNRVRFRTSYLILAALAAGGLTYAYPSAEIIAPFFLLSCGLIYLFNRRRDLAIMLAVYGAFVAPLFYLIIFEPSSNFARFNAVKLSGTGWVLIKEVLVRYRGYYSANFYFGSVGMNPMMHVPGIGNFFGFLAVFAVLAIAIILVPICWGNGKLKWTTWRREFKRRRNVLKLILFGIIWMALGPLPASVSIDQEHVTRAIFMFPLVTLLITLAVYLVISKARYYWLQCTIAIVFVLMSLHSLHEYEYIYNHTYPPLAATTQFQYGVSQGIEFMAAHQTSYKKIVVDSHINQPYIYYLFYTNYNPKHLPYAQINVGFTGKYGYMVPRIGSWYFSPLSPVNSKEGKLLKTIEGYGKVWYKIYSVDNNTELLMIQENTPLPL